MADGSPEKGMRFKDKVIIITGGCSGIGKGCVDVFTDHGGKVALFDINDAMGEKLAGKAGNGEILYIHCDTSNEEQVKAAIQKTVDNYGKVDCLLNNAGVHPPEFTIDDFSVDDFRKVLEINLIGYFSCCKYALPYLRQSKGNIVNIASQAQLGMTNATIYCASKGGVTALAKGLALDEATYGVRVNSISPGAVDTPMLRSLMDPEKIKERAVLNRVCDPKEIGYACLFLATDATYCTGIDIFATAGFEMGCWK